MIRKIVASLAFIIVCACGFVLSRGVSWIGDLGPVFVIVWLLVAAKVVSWLVVKAGWEK